MFRIKKNGKIDLPVFTFLAKRCFPLAPLNLYTGYASCFFLKKPPFDSDVIYVLLSLAGFIILADASG